jgi:tRNA pseudouridine38-40 synthase
MDTLPERVWRLTLAYDGTAYAGWQVQPGRATVQGLLNDKLAKLFGAPIRTQATSRTDAGVHALDQQVSAELPAIPPIPPGDALRALGKFLPDDIRVLAIDEAPLDFHARHAAAGKAYTYLIYRGLLRSPFLGRYAWPVAHPLDPAAMRRAAADLLGEHDFTPFSVNPRSDEPRDPVKTLHRCEVQELDRLLMITVVGNAFLYRMVRRLVGYLVAVGLGKLSPEGTPALFAANARTATFETALAQGLFLDRVFFSPEPLSTYRRTTLPFLDLR